MQSSSRSKDRATGCASTPTSCPNTSGPKPISRPRRSRRRFAGAVDPQKTEAPITPTVDRHTRQTGEFYFGTYGEITIGIYRQRRVPRLEGSAALHLDLERLQRPPARSARLLIVRRYSKTKPPALSAGVFLCRACGWSAGLRGARDQSFASSVRRSVCS